MTKLEVIDSAIKIGLGSLITLIGTFLVAWLNHRNDHKKERNKRFYDSLEKISVSIEETTHMSLRYWALIIEWVRNNQQGMALTNKRAEELEKTKSELFDMFKHLTVAESQLMLLGLQNISCEIREYGEFLKNMRRSYYDGNESLKESDLDDVRSELLEKRKAIFDSLSNAYRSGL
ncbi:hypothetical protein [Alteromonas stellipolaris]|uniref:hypothetical protein n=1 Tax=Alteromonas stellipolaris TaxID=233316 RepID=UPI002733ACFE|nr:hypothetical protein [Alteromonas stellipolaris]MDP2537270.1 hypothetical protein [Alteromonas stellipolaris]